MVQLMSKSVCTVMLSGAQLQLAAHLRGSESKRLQLPLAPNKV